MSSEPLHILQTYWKHTAFRPLQEDIIHAVLEGRDCLALLPTGAGKSLCYQIPALCKSGLAIVVSPLIALMKDQVDQLSRLGIRAAAVYSGMSGRSIDFTLDNCIYGNYKLLYVSPERLKSDLFIERAKRMDINLIAVDEAHCISQWGHDFRPSYLEIAQFRSIVPHVNVLAVTASATPQVVEEISERLSLRSHTFFNGNFFRENLSLSVRKVEDKDTKLLEILRKIPGSAIVYVRSRKGTREIHDLLHYHKTSSDFYHAGIHNQQRAEKQEAWQKGRIRVMVSTNAFGMGIDKSDVRTVVHYDIPGNLESYYQEAGRAGRDQKKAFAVLLYQEADLGTLRRLLEQSSPDGDYLKRIYQALANYYKMAVGTSQLRSFDYDHREFCSTYRLNTGEAMEGLKKLQDQGFLDLNEGFFQPSTLRITVSKAKLYEYQIAHKEADVLVKALMRLYGGGLFSDLMKISEMYIARYLNITSHQVVRDLTLLDQNGMVAYERFREAPQITFLTPRYDASKLPVNTKLLRERAALKVKKTEEILDYTVQDATCRMDYFSTFFTGKSHGECGICDVCIERKKDRKSRDLDIIRDIVLYELKKTPQPPEEITGKYTEHEQDDFATVIRALLENNIIVYDKFGRLRLQS